MEDHYDYYISYQFIDNRHGTFTKDLVDKYCINASNGFNIIIPKDINNLCLEFVGDQSFTFWYGPYKTVREYVSYVTYRCCAEVGKLMKIKYDPNYPNNRVILALESKIILSKLFVSVVGLSGSSVFLWFLIEFVFDKKINRYGINTRLIVILFMVLCIILISIISMVIISYLNQSFYFRKNVQTELHCAKNRINKNYLINKVRHDWKININNDESDNRLLLDESDEFNS